MERILDEFDKRLLNLIQVGVPLVERPFDAITQELGLSEEQVISRLAGLRAGGVIRQISAIFDSKALGYQSTLVAACVKRSDLEHAVAAINAHPGVSHNYLRDHVYNVWYTLAVPPDSRIGLAATVDLLHAQSRATATRVLPTLRLFKIGVRFDVGGEADLSARSEAAAFTHDHQERASRLSLIDADKRMIRALQQDLPLVRRPFDGWAQEAGVTVAELLEAAERYRRENRMRRFSAVLRHREVGFSANGMGVWAVPAGCEEDFGSKAAMFDAVSHCYLRPTYPDWPYNVFTMVHAPTREACEEVLAAISLATGVADYATLYSRREFKKTRVKYFLGDTEEWEERQRFARAHVRPSCATAFERK